MLIHQYLWLGLSLFIVNGVQNYAQCSVGEQRDEVVSSIPSVRVLLENHGVNLGESVDVSDEIADFYSRTHANSLNKKGERTADEEASLGSIYARSSNHAKTVGMQQNLLLEALRHYLKAAEQGRVDALMTIALFFEALEKIATDDFLNGIDPKDNLEDAVIDLFKLAADAGIPDAQTAYEDRSSARSSPEGSMDSHGSGR